MQTNPIIPTVATQGQLPITLTTHITALSAALVILSAGVLGYTALYDLFLSIGLFSAWLGIFFPLLFDLAEVTAAVAVFNAKLQDEDDKFAWGMVILFTVLGIVANIAHAGHAWQIGKIDDSQAILAVFCTSLFPLSVALVTHLVKRVIARDIKRRGHLSSLAELTTLIDTHRADLDKLSGQISAAQAKLEAIKLDIKAGQTVQNVRSVAELNAAKYAKIEQRRANVLGLLKEGVSPDDISTSLGVSLRTVKRDMVALNGQAAGVTR